MLYRHHIVPKTAATALLLLGIGNAFAAEVTVTATQGAVTINQAGHVIAAPMASKLTLPIEVHTGATGSVDLEQMGSKVHIGPNSVLVLPAPVASQGLVDRIVQQAGYALYNIKTRKEHPLAVQTPYLVSVVKGTVFTIAVEDHASTVALMEGSLDISAPGVPEHVLLKPNESVRHAEGEAHLSAHATTPTAFLQSGDAVAPIATAVPEATATTQMAQVARDFADVGAAVAPNPLRDVSRIPPSGQTTTSQPSGGGASLSSGDGSSGSSSSATTGTTSGSSGTVTSTGDSGGTSTSSGSSSTGSSSTGSSSTGSSTTGSSTTGSSTAGAGGTSTTTGSASSGSAATGATGTDSGSTGGSSSSGTVTLPSSGSSTTTTTTTTTTGCNGKSNGTGAGKCLGHSKG